MQSLKPPRALVVGAGWLAAALIATLAGLIGIRLVGDSLTSTPGGVRSEAEVARALAAATPATTQPTPSQAPAQASTPPPVQGPTSAKPTNSGTSFTSAGGTATVHCEPGDLAFLDSWSPHPGYQARDYDRGPDDDVEVRFEGADGRVELKFFCRGGVPVVEPKHGGGDD
ncbi:septum formation initiator [Actinoplanes solisilvae]|uniref:septum formation initiator n=1 Tax=Actinoplanes solisilvae TaxID=2486853 RepID=UPI000FD86B92|nr:septum formation initiator [Actinoplanes solisilvae]